MRAGSTHLVGLPDCTLENFLLNLCCSPFVIRQRRQLFESESESLGALLDAFIKLGILVEHTCNTQGR